MVGYVTLISTGQNFILELALVVAGIFAMWLVSLASEQGVRQTARQVLQLIRNAWASTRKSPAARDSEPTTVRTRR
jgi:hypothetical protein